MRGVQKTVNQHSGVQAKAAVPQVEDAPKVVEQVKVAEPIKEIETPKEDLVTLTAADPRMKLEVSINGNIWVGHSITIPKQYEADVRSLLEGAGMYVKN